MLMRFQINNMVAEESWKSPEQRSDGFASSEVKATSSLRENHMSENEMHKGKEN